MPRSHFRNPLSIAKAQKSRQFWSRRLLSILCSVLFFVTLIDWVPIEFTRNDAVTEARGDFIFVSYAYSESSRNDSARNLLFFLRNGVTSLPKGQKILYGIVVNGECTNAACLAPTRFIREKGNALVRKWDRENVGFDFGAHAHALQGLADEDRSFQFYIFLNCGVVGPILPSYMPNNWHWTSAFLDRLQGKVGLVGTSIVCLPASDAGGYGPSVEGFAFALTRQALKVAVAKGTSFRSHVNKVAAILQGEYALTDVLLKNGFSIDSLLIAYEGIDWSDSSEWHCNNFTHPSRRGSYFGISINPLEVIFHKVTWGSQERPADALEQFTVMKDETDLYVKWKRALLLRKRADN
jgi:hypothetical protein